MQVWDEKEQAVDADVLKEGFLVKVIFDNASLEIKHGRPLWIYQGWDSSDFECLIFKAPDGLMPNTLGRMCDFKTEIIWANHIRLLEIVAREWHAVHAIFNAWGAEKIECERLKQAISNATAHLTGV